MKTKAIILLAVSAVVTLSFTFVSVNTQPKQEVTTTSVKSEVYNEPVGGFVMEDKM